MSEQIEVHFCCLLFFSYLYCVLLFAAEGILNERRISIIDSVAKK